MKDIYKDTINCSVCNSMNDKSWTACCKCGATPLEDAESAMMTELHAKPTKDRSDTMSTTPLEPPYHGPATLPPEHSLMQPSPRPPIHSGQIPSAIPQPYKTPMAKSPDHVLNAPGYDQLAQVLSEAFHQASGGKGKERHANDLAFHEQPMQQIAARRGIGFILGQADKKSEEAQGMLERGQSAAAIQELLGAIVYLSGAIIHIRNQSK